MSDMMTFPDTWEEYERSYGFYDTEEVYTNGSRLIPSFRVRQWLDHHESERKKGKWIPVTKIVTVKDSGIGWPTEHVEWVDTTEPDEIDAVRCSECGEVFDFEGARNWCTECGTDMRGEQE